MLCPGFLCVVLAVQGKPPAIWPVCPSPVELLPERELYALRKQFRGAWLPARADAAPPAERLIQLSGVCDPAFGFEIKSGRLE